MLNIAMLSKWHVHAEEYANCFNECENTRVSVVWDTDIKRGNDWAETLGCEFESDLSAVLSREDVDAVCVTTETSMHKEVMLACAKANKPIFTEKVLAPTNEDAKIIAQAIKENDLPFCIALRRLTEPRIIHAKKLLTNGVLGKVTHARIRDAHDGATAGWLPDTFFDKKTCGGGAMMDLGAHPMYLSNYFLGEPLTVTSVFTEVLKKGADDNCVSVMTYNSGAICVCETAFVSCKSPFSLEICGTDGHLYLSDDMDGILLTTKDGKVHISSDDMEDVQILPVKRFAKAMNEKTTPPFGIDEAVILTRLMDAAYKSAQNSRTELYKA